ncbi:hypothetical protein [Oceanobacillus alkalisoli]|uniref:hypothetical protein n=1 Tax=Oceanobacillus alkalisoli TaxID=2925113 RepID=UPI001EF1280F|nr:hypothetical protein [Oceanobacillus alkalisoli]MCF3942876.1 hypothetical protein [Oceanobacillus alkalisoli]MCG5102400.1 hypothetical protein [Oceanobacillus alkalisoli]
MNLELKNIKLPDFGIPEDRPVIPKEVYEERCSKLYEAAKCDWIFIYGDREHFGNLYYLSGFDPRFEEAALAIGPKNKKYLLVGNEGFDYSFKANKVDAEVLLTQSFSLLGQDRTQAPRLDNILREIGMSKEDTIGVIGWKYLEETETIPHASNIFIPAMIVDGINSIIEKPVVDVTKVLMNPTDGLRAINEVEEIVGLEFGAARASMAVNRIIEGSNNGMTEFQAVSNMGYAGDPLSAHIMFSSGKDKIIGLSSPTARELSKGDGVTTAVGYWGGLSCRAGLLADYDEEFLNEQAIPYFKGIAAWYEYAAIGVSGGDLFEKVSEVLAEGGLRPALNPGHLTSMDEWLHTPVRPNSQDVIQSGMAIQLDIIPAPLVDGVILNCEDSVVFADENLRKQLAEKYPEVWKRITLRQRFLREEIGLNIDDSLLPLSSNPGYYSPFWLSPESVLTAK